MKYNLNIVKCRACELWSNQKLFYPHMHKVDIMWVGISGKNIDGVTFPLDSQTATGKIIEEIEKKIEKK